MERFGKVIRDDHGHLRLGEIEFGRLMKELLTARLEKLGIKMTFIDKDLGYELRCADPIPFDAEYTRDLGYGAVKFLLSPEAEKYGAIISFVDGKMIPLPFDKMLDPKTGRMQNAPGQRGRRSLRMRLRLHDPAGTRRFRGRETTRQTRRRSFAHAGTIPRRASATSPVEIKF